MLKSNILNLIFCKCRNIDVFSYWSTNFGVYHSIYDILDATISISKLYKQKRGVNIPLLITYYYTNKTYLTTLIRKL